MNQKTQLGAKLVQGGIDHGTAWHEISIPPRANSEDVADMLYESFDDRWCRDLIKHLKERIVEE